jgi:hypothetical protein
MPAQVEAALELRRVQPDHRMQSSVFTCRPIAYHSAHQPIDVAAPYRGGYHPLTLPSAATKAGDRRDEPYEFTREFTNGMW